MIEAGTLLQQRYKIDRQIGQGGMGAVYVATDERFGSTVAIKETLFMDSNFRKAIEREARLLNSLKHSALPRVTDHFEESNSQFLVMEYITGEDLSTIIERENKPFEVHDVLDWADQLLDALDFLHTQDIPVVHRDIKPQNLKLTPNGRIVLLDFGLAKGNPTDASHQTAAKSIFGYSRNYASLEQIQGTGTDPRSDLYSLSATLYHLLTGVPPEDALTRAMSVLSKRPDSLVPANLVRSAIPSGVAGVLQKGLDLDAAGRPASAAEMRQMLKEYERYGYLIDAEMNSHLAMGAVPLVNETSTGREQTASAAVLPSEVKTEVLPGNLSQVTAVRLTGSTAGVEASNSPRETVPATALGKSRRPFAIGAALVGLLLIGGALAGGVYKYAPFSSGSNVNPDQAGSDKPAANPAAAADNAAAPVSAGEAGTAGSQASSVPESAPVTVERSKQPQAEPERSSETTRIPKSTEDSQSRGQNELPDTPIPPEMTGPGRSTTVVTRRNPDGSVTTMQIPNGEPRQPNQQRGVRINPRTGYPGGFDPNNLPPAVKRKMAEALRKKGIPTITIPN